MNRNDVDYEAKLNELFSSDKNRFILWVDSEKKFLEEIQNLNLDCEIIYIDESPSIETKYHIEESDNNFLLYSNKDNISLEDNFLGDILTYAYRFSADKTSIILNDIGIPNEFRDLIENYLKFLNDKTRRNSFKKLNIEKYTPCNIRLGVLCACVKEYNLKVENLLRKILSEGFKDNKYMELYDKYDLLDDFWDLIRSIYSYEDKKPSLFKLFSCMLLTYTNIQFNNNFPSVLESYVLDDMNNVPVFLDNFMNNVKYRENYNMLSQIVSDKLKLSDKFKNNQLDDYIECDAFSLFDENILHYYVDILNSNKQELNINIVESRKTTHYYEDYLDYYLLVDYANNFIGVLNRFEEVVLPDDINKLIELFTTDYSVMDKYYRKFYYHYDRLSDEFKSFDKLDDLRVLIENMYYNMFLVKINNKFNDLLGQLDSVNDIALTKQWNFYREIVRPSANKHRTIVIISDAFRYGNALELNKRMEFDPTKKTKLDAMLSTIPSYTVLGMASLLPNDNIEYRKDKVFVNDLSTEGTENREKILKNALHNSKAIQYKDIINMNKKELKNFFIDTQLVYVYHNTVDKTGEDNEEKVFNAVEEALTEIEKLITKLTNYQNCKHFYVTSDHGFIYKRDALHEFSKQALEEYNQYDLIVKDRRFILTDTPTDIDNTICLSLEYMNINDIFVTVPFGVNVFKTSGGMQFAHGGAALEEIIIPLLYVNTTMGKSNLQKQVELQLIDNKRKITSNVTNIRFFQKENISENITPLKAAVYFVDATGDKISDENIIYADVSSNDPEDREFIVKCTFQDKKYAKNKDYYLVVKDLDNNVEIDRYNYIMDIAFQDDFNFF